MSTKIKNGKYVESYRECPYCRETEHIEPRQINTVIKCYGCGKPYRIV